MTTTDHDKPWSQEEAATPRLEEINTNWSLLRHAHQGPLTATGPARNALALRYNRPIVRYLRSLLGNEDDAGEVAQEILLRMLQGDFAGVTAEKGRFRDYLKKAVRNTALNFLERKHRTSNRVKTLATLPENEAALLPRFPSLEEQDRQWLAQWRGTLLTDTFRRLGEHQERHAPNLYCTVMCLRRDHENETMQQLASRLAAVTGQPMTEGAFRVQLKRARHKFAELLLEEVACTLAEPSPEHVEEELINLGLLEYVHDFLPPDWRVSGMLLSPG